MGPAVLVKPVLMSWARADFGQLCHQGQGLKIGYLAQHVRTEWNDNLSIWDTMLAVFRNA